ncbi:hypothetical protein U9M48_011517 [Paspalum notatum var. saurae]|uniref:F-box domain-containing protein n=1 Tax=Paspalum notatum var. saurae TaxID=547442 RepID=A0AAQ3SVL9_PASNO
MVYSSAIDVWSANSISVALHDHYSVMELEPSLLIGSALYFTLRVKDDGRIVRILNYDLDSHVLSVVDTPGFSCTNTIPIKAEDGGLGFISVLENSINLISSQQADGSVVNGTAGRGGGGRWATHRVIDLDTLLPKSRVPSYQRRVSGYIEGTHTIFVSTDIGVFTLELKSSLVKKVSTARWFQHILPYTSFCTPEELIEEILLRLPPEEPTYLVRAALVCKAWRNVLSAGGGFLRRYREFHGTPPMLGYLCNTRDRAQFVSTTSAASPPMSMPKASHSDNIKWVLDCRHGRVLIHDRRCSYGYAYGSSIISFIMAPHSIISFIIWD